MSIKNTWPTWSTITNMELLAFIIGLMIMGPIVFLYFLLQDLKKRIVKIEKNLNDK